MKDLRNYFWKGFNATSLFMNKVMTKNKRISLAYILAVHLKSLICKNETTHVELKINVNLINK